MHSYISRNDAINACSRLQKFYQGLRSYYMSFGLDVESNRGRRNILMSEPMERFIADELSKSFEGVISDGRTGKSDIVFTNGKGVEVEIECKLTSPHESSGSIAFQTDYETLFRKGTLDYIYLIANADFTGFCCVYFSGLTVDDFRSLSPGARGKVQMYKHKGMKKATVLLGEVIDRKEVQLEKIEKKIQEHQTKYTDDRKNLTCKIKNLTEKCPEKQERKALKIYEQLLSLDQNYKTKLYKLREKIIIKNEANSSYSFKYEELKNEITSYAS